MFEIEILKRVLDDYGYFWIIVMLFFLKVNIFVQRNSGKKVCLLKKVYKIVNVLFFFIYLVLRIYLKIFLIIGLFLRYIKKFIYKCLF